MIQKQVLLWDAPLLSHDKDPNAIVMPSGVGWEEWNDDVWRVFEVASPRPGKLIPPLDRHIAYRPKLISHLESFVVRNHHLWNRQDSITATSKNPKISKQPWYSN